MVLHELATNAAKYGALSSEAGALDISGSSEEDLLTIVWAETGGPTIDQTPSLNGFGSKMIRQNLARRLGGTIEYEWPATGLVATLTMRMLALRL